MSSYEEWWHQEGGARVPDREQYCARIQEAHRSRNMDAYWQAINGYATAAREACRMKKKLESMKRSGA